MGLCKDGYWRESERYEGKKYIGCGKDQKSALKDLNAKIEGAKNGTTTINGNTTVAAWVDVWLETYVKHKDITPETYRNISYKVKKNIVEEIRTMKVKDVKEVHLQKILNAQAGMSKSHVTKLRAYMKQIFHRAVKSKMILSNPAEDLTLPKAEDNKRRALTRKEKDAILSTAASHPAGLWVKLMLYTGIRPGETIALQWRDVNLKKGVVTIHKALESGSKDTIKKPKSDAGIRMVPIPKHLIPDLAAKKGKPGEYVFTQVLPENKGKHHTKSSLRSYWGSFVRQLDIDLGATVYRNKIVESKVAKDLTPYVLRHTYGTDLQAAGVPINIAKYLMGHAQISTTANIYTHETEESMALAAKLINAHAVKKVVKNQ